MRSNRKANELKFDGVEILVKPPARIVVEFIRKELGLCGQNVLSQLRS